MQNKKTLVIIGGVVILAVLAIIIGLVLIGKSQNSANQKANQDQPNSGAQSNAPIDVKLPKSQQEYQKIASDLVEKTSTGSASASDYYKLGVSYYNLRQFDKAFAAYQKAVALDPKNATYISNIGNVLRDQDKYDEAEKYYKQATGIDPSFTDAWVSWAIMSLVNQNDKDKMIQILQDGLSINPNNTTLKQLLDSYNK